MKMNEAYQRWFYEGIEQIGDDIKEIWEFIKACGVYLVFFGSLLVIGYGLFSLIVSIPQMNTLGLLLHMLFIVGNSRHWD